MRVVVKKTAAFDAAISKFVDSVRKDAEAAAIGLSKVILNHILYVSPQYSGDFVANWKVGVNDSYQPFKMNAVSPDHRNHGSNDGTQSFVPYQKGSPRAIAYAKSHASWANFKLGDRIRLYNSAFHPVNNEDAGHGAIENYAYKIEAGLISFRPVNKGADHVMRRGITFAMNRYSDITRSKLNTLRSFGV